MKQTTGLGLIVAAVLIASTHHAYAIPPSDKLHWGPDYYTITCKPALQTKTYAELWPMMTQQERQAVNIAQQESYYREEDLYRSWVRAFQKVIRSPEHVKARGQIYPGPVTENFGIEIASKGASDTLAACVEHMARLMDKRH
ncbi:MAG: hypothetical protein U0172_02415 [Nitrospiraceae bacterium]